MPTDIDVALRILANRTCRNLLYQLAANPSDSADLDVLLETCAERTERDRDTLEIECHHVHFPALETAGVLDVDEQTRECDYHRDPVIEELLDTIQRLEE